MVRRYGLMLVLVLFGGYTLAVMATAEQSLWAFGLELMSKPDTAQVVIDLYIACGLLSAWMYGDHRRRGGKLWTLLPFLLLTLVFASVGPLLYLLMRDWRGRA